MEEAASKEKVNLVLGLKAPAVRESRHARLINITLGHAK